jgi:dCTP deaminase
MLADYEIERDILSGHLGVHPYDPALLQPNSLDVRLDRHFLVPTELSLMDTADVPPGHMRELEADYVDLAPRAFVLGSTVEVVDLPSTIVGQVEGKSSIGRLGLLVHVTAGVIDSGFNGNITLEIVNLSPWTVRLHAGMTIGQVTFRRCSRVDRPYASRYQGQRGPVESMYTGAAHALATDVPGA